MLPITCTQRYSVRSSHHRSRIALVAQSSNGRRPNFSTKSRPESSVKAPRRWTDTTPLPGPSPEQDTLTASTFFHNSSTETILARPEMVHVKNDRKGWRKDTGAAATSHPTKAGLTVKTQPISSLTSEHQDGTRVHSAHTNVNRWSWTNSEAPSTPRFELESTSSPSGTRAAGPKLKRMNSWTSYQMDHIEEDNNPLSRDGCDHSTLVKDVAVEPRGGTRPLHSRVSSLTSIFRKPSKSQQLASDHQRKRLSPLGKLISQTER